MKMLDLILTSQKHANVTPLESTGRGRRPETYRRTCVCCFQVMPGTCAVSVPSPFPVPFALSRGPASKNVFLVSFVETKR